MNRRNLFNHLSDTIGFGSPEIARAFQKINRKDFVSDDFEEEAYLYYPLPIGFGQTISQPSTVLYMFNLLNPKPGDKILDIGSGSGWTTALLSNVVGVKGRVWGIELVPELVKFGNKNIGKYHFSQTKILEATPNAIGYIKKAPYDKILVSAAAGKMPETLKEQLKIGGVLVIPIKDSVFKINKQGQNKFSEEEHYGFAFVLLKGF